MCCNIFLGGGGRYKLFTGILGNIWVRDVAKLSTLGGGGGVVMFWPTFPRILTKSYKFFPKILSTGRREFFHHKHNKSFKIVKFGNHFITFSNFDHLLSQNLTKFPSFSFNFKQISVPFWPTLGKYQLHFDKLTNVCFMGGGGGGYTPL